VLARGTAALFARFGRLGLRIGRLVVERPLLGAIGGDSRFGGELLDDFDVFDHFFAPSSFFAPRAFWRFNGPWGRSGRRGRFSVPRGRSGTRSGRRSFGDRLEPERAGKLGPIGLARTGWRSRFGFCWLGSRRRGPRRVRNGRSGGRIVRLDFGSQLLGQIIPMIFFRHVCSIPRWIGDL
jgi:hypothetical protein